MKKRRSPKIRKGVTTENCETKKVNMKRSSYREKEGEIYSRQKIRIPEGFVRSFCVCRD